MNIFVLDNNPTLAAQYQCDKLVVKMILESAQLLCAAFHLQGVSAPYRLTHKNHPSSIWARKSKANFEWLLTHAKELCKEYTFRYNKCHKTEAVIQWISDNYSELNFPETSLTKFHVAIAPDKLCRRDPDFSIDNPVNQYRLYYKYDKAHFCRWTKREIPSWFTPLLETT